MMLQNQVLTKKSYESMTPVLRYKAETGVFLYFFPP